MTAIKGGSGGAPTRAWLATVVRRLASRKHREDRHRRDRETRAVEDRAGRGALGHGSVVPTPEELLARGETQRLVIDAVLELAEPNRSTLLLRYYEGLSPKEIADRLDLSAGTVRVRLSRGAAQVRARLDEVAGGDRSRWTSALLPLALPLAATGSQGSGDAAGPGTSKTAVGGSAAGGGITMLVTATVLAAIGIFALLQDRQVAPLESVLPLETARTPSLAIATPLPGATATRTHATEATALSVPASAVESAKATTGPLRLMDRHTSGPAAHVRFSEPWAERSDDPDEDAPVWETDGNGLATIPLGVESIVLRHVFDSAERAHAHFEPYVGTSRPDTISVTWEKGEATAEMDPGLTVRLAFEGAAVTHSDLFAILSRDERMGTWGVFHSGVRTAGSAWFVRFPRPDGGTRGYWLHFVTRDGLRGASYSVHDYVDTTAVLRVDLTERGRLWGSLLPDSKGEGLDERLLEANVMLFTGTVTSDQVKLPWMENVKELHRRNPTSPRSFRFDALAPGDYTLCVHARGFEPLWMPYRIHAGESAPVPVEMHWLNEPTATLRGIITSQSGRYAEPLMVLVRDERTYMPVRNLHVPVVWSTEGGQSVGTFELPDLAIDSYKVSILGGDHVHRLYGLPHLVRAAEWEAVPGGEPLRIELSDGQTTRPLAVEVVDAETGDPVKWFDLTAFPASQDPDEMAAGVLGANGEDGHGRFGSVVVGFEYMLAVHADGYMLLHEPMTPGPEPDPLKLKLQPGWSGFPYCVDSVGTPIEGIKVYCDGEPMGKTDARGSLLLSLPSPPTTVELLLAGDPPLSNDFLDEHGNLKGEIAQGHRMLNATFERP